MVRIQVISTLTQVIPPSEAIRRFLHKSHDTAVSYIRSDSVGIVQQDAPKQPGESHARAGRIVYGLPWDTSAEDVLMRTGWDCSETMYVQRVINGVCLQVFKRLHHGI